MKHAVVQLNNLQRLIWKQYNYIAPTCWDKNNAQPENLILNCDKFQSKFVINIILFQMSSFNSL